MNEEERLILPAKTPSHEVDSIIDPFIEKGYIIAGFSDHGDGNIEYILRLLIKSKG